MGSQSLDQAARQMGFKNYAQYSAWQAQQQAMRSRANAVGVGTVGQPAPQPQPAAPPQNWLQRLLWGLGGGK